MEQDEDDFPRIGRDFQNWSDLDSLIWPLDLDIELFRRRNVWIARYVILAGLLKGDGRQRQAYTDILTPKYFDPKSLSQYLFEKITRYLRESENVPVSELEGWVFDYFIDVWNEKPPKERMLYSSQKTLRLILSFAPTEEQVNRAIELRKCEMERRGWDDGK